MATDRIDIIELEDGTLVTSDGEVLDIPEGTTDFAAWAANEHFYADQEAKAWSRRKAIMGSLLMRKQDGPKAQYEGALGTIVGTVKKNARTGFNAAIVSDELEAKVLYPLIELASGSEMGESAIEELIAFAHAVKGLDGDRLPVSLAGLEERARFSLGFTAPWYETALARKPAPRGRRAE